MLEVLQILNHLWLLTFVGSLLAALALRVVNGPEKRQIDLVREYRATADRAARLCCSTRAVVMSLDRASIMPCCSAKELVAFRSDQATARAVDEADQLMRTLAGLPKNCGELPVSHLKRHIKTLRNVEQGCVKVLQQLEARNGTGLRADISADEGLEAILD